MDTTSLLFLIYGYPIFELDIDNDKGLVDSDADTTGIANIGIIEDNYL